MAILNHAGAETGNLSDALSTVGTASAQTSVKRTGSYAYRVNPTTTGDGTIDIGENTNGAGRASSNPHAIYAVTFYFRYATKPASNDEEIFVFNDTSFAYMGSIRINSSGVLLFYDNGGALHDTGTIALSADTWYRIEAKMDRSGVDFYEVKINGTVDLSGTYDPGNDIASISLGKVTNRNNQTVDFFYDDICTDDADYPGEGEVKLGDPIGAGADSAWDAGTGTTSVEADEIPHDGDTSYIGADALDDNKNHTFDMQSAATIGISGTIKSVKVSVIARSDSTGGTSAIRLRYLSGGSAFEGNPEERGTTYAMLAKILNTDPFDSGAWTATKFDTVEVGMAADALAQVQRFTAAYIQAWYTPPSFDAATLPPISAVVPSFSHSVVGV